jgi:cytochrome c biogenesis protein CcdA
MSAGGSMLAMTRSRPPHCRQVSRSMANTRLRRCAQVRFGEPSAADVAPCGLGGLAAPVLAQQQLPAAAHYAYLALYILGYIADDSLMVATAVIALSSRRLTERAGRWLKLLSGAVMLALGLVMLLRPDWLD